MKMTIIADEAGKIIAFRKCETTVQPSNVGVSPSRGHVQHDVQIPERFLPYFNDRVRELTQALRLDLSAAAPTLIHRV